MRRPELAEAVDCRPAVLRHRFVLDGAGAAGGERRDPEPEPLGGTIPLRVRAAEAVAGGGPGARRGQREGGEAGGDDADRDRAPEAGARRPSRAATEQAPTAATAATAKAAP